MISLCPSDELTRHPEFPAWLAAHGGWYEDTNHVVIDRDSVTVTQLRFNGEGRPFIEGDEIATRTHTIPLDRTRSQFMRWRLDQEVA